MIVSEVHPTGERPQPKPRLSLLVNPQDFIQKPLYENLHSLRNELLDYPNKSKSSQGKGNYVTSKSKPRRRSFLDLPLSDLSIFKSDKLSETELITYDAYETPEIIYNCMHENKCLDENNDSPLISLLHSVHLDSSSVKLNGDENLNEEKFKTDNISDTDSIQSKTISPHSCENNINYLHKIHSLSKTNYNSDLDVNIQNFQYNSEHNYSCTSFRPIRCMPYNSPQLTKGPKGLGSLQTGSRKDAKSTISPKTVNKTSPPKMSNVTNKVDSVRSSIRPVKDRLTNSAIPARSERGAVSTLQQLRRPSFRKLEEASSRDSDSSDCSSGASNGSASSILSSVKKRSEGLNARNTEFRRSAAVPPKTVANLTSKFNAIISQNQHTSDNSVTNNKAVKLIESNSSLAKSCPSSPLRTNLKTAAVNHSKKDFKSVVTKPNRHFVRGSVLHSSFPERSKDGEIRKNTTHSDFHASDSDSSISTSSSIGPKSYVKRTVLNYEVNISSASSSPELERKCSFSRRTSDSSSSCSSPLLSKKQLQNATSLVRTTNISNEKEVGPSLSYLNSSRTTGSEEIIKKTIETCKDEKPRKYIQKESSPLSSNCEDKRNVTGKKTFQSNIGVDNKQACNTAMTTTRILNIRRNIQPISLTSTLSEDILSQTSSLMKDKPSNITAEENLLCKDDLQTNFSFHEDKEMGKNIGGKLISNVSESTQKQHDSFSALSPICKARMILERRNIIATENTGLTKTLSETRERVLSPCPSTFPVHLIPPPLPATGPRLSTFGKTQSKGKTEKISSLTIMEKSQNSQNTKSSFYLHSKLEEANNTAKELKDNEFQKLSSQLSNAKSSEVSPKSETKLYSENNFKSVRSVNKNVLEANEVKTSTIISKDEIEKPSKVSLKTTFLHSFEVDKQEKINKIWHAETFTTDVKDDKKELIVKKLEIGKSNYVPNTSFLWREVKFQKSNSELNMIPPPPTTAPPPIPSQTESTNSLPFQQDEESNIYDDVISPISEDDYNEPLYSEAVIPTCRDSESNSSEEYISQETTTYVGITQQLNLQNKEESKEITDNNVHNDSDEGWEDVSDAEPEIGIFKHSSLPLQMRSRSHIRKSSSKQMFRRSWSQALRDRVSSSDDLLEAKENEQNNFKSSLHEGSFDSDDSSSTDPSHHYEALYEVVSQENEKNDLSERTCSSRQIQRNESIETCCIIEESPDAIDDQDYIVDDFQKKTTAVEIEKPKQLKRNWSLTKSDIRLELTSRLNRIRIKKTSTSASDVHMESIDGQNGENKKKAWSLKTKFSKKKSNGPSVIPNSLSPKKESALFYVENYVNQSGDSENVNDNPVYKDSQTKDAESSDKHILLEKKTTDTDWKKLDTFIGLTSAAGGRAHVSSRNKVVRPKTAPPAPPSHPPRLKEKSYLEDSLSKENISSTSKTKISHQEIPNASLDDKNLINACDNDKNIAQETKTNFDVESVLSSIQYADLDPKHSSSVPVSRSNSAASSESEFYHLSKITQKRASLTSTTSTSSSDTYIQMGEPETTRLMLSAIAAEAVEYRNSKTSLIEPLSSDNAEIVCSNEKSKIYDSVMLASFEDEPLYQIYTKFAQKRATQLNLCEDGDELEEYENYEKISELSLNYDYKDAQCFDVNIPVKTQTMDLIASSGGGQRTLWGELPEVRNSGLLETISPQVRKLQEAMFEVITSEASYLKSLNVLTNHFMQCKEFVDEYSPNCVLNRREKSVLFSDILPVKEVSEKLLADLEKRWQESIMINEICDILYKHAKNNFSVYITYCSNQVHQDEMLKELKEKNSQFVEVLGRLERNPVCQNLSMHSFIMLPMQRITRLPLLVDSIFNKLEEGTPQYERCKLALNTINKVVQDCNDGANKMMRYKEMLQITRTLDFRDKKGVPLISATRNVWLVKKGHLNRIVFCDSTSRLSFRRCYRQMISLFLFTDILIITKKKGEEAYQVLDYCPRNMVQALKIMNIDVLPMRPPDGCKNLFQLTLLQNHERRTVEFILSCNLESDCDRWIDALTPSISEDPNEKIYEKWDCPQVQVIHEYKAKQPDELNLEESDVINVFKKVSDGWYLGERLRDGMQGWFPANYVREIISEHVRARNLRQRYRLLQCLEEQRREST